MEVQGNHFIARFLSEEDRPFVNAVLARAESYYKNISDNIGFSRYQNFWTWEKRVNIVLYPDQPSFLRFSGQPSWSLGYASRDSQLFHTKTITSYAGQEAFLDTILPHEIAHLILWDYLGFSRRVPVWFEEGVAQLEEKGKRGVVQKAMAGVFSAKQHFSFAAFSDMNLPAQDDRVKVSVYYAQSLSIVDFMLSRYGQDAFHRLFKALRSGHEFEEALRKTYPAIFNSISDLERKWQKYLEEQASVTGG
jgi:hypothetical protein